MNTLKKLFFSFQTTLVLLLVFFISIGVATFIENDFGTDTARALVYNATWFELLLLLLAINFTGNIFIGKLYRKEKLTILLFHLAFIIILLGAGITRFFGEEGMMHIRQGQSNNQYTTDDYYLSATVISNNDRKEWNKRLLLSTATKNKIRKSFSVNGKKIKLEMLDFMPDALQQAVPGDTGPAVINLVVSGGAGREEHQIKEGASISSHGITISFEDSLGASQVKIRKSGDSLIVTASLPIEIVTMGNLNQTNVLEPGKQARFNPLTLYKAGELTMVMKQYLPHATIKVVPNPTFVKDRNMPDAMNLRLTSGNEHKEVTLWGGKGFEGTPQTVTINGASVSLQFGSRSTQVPFQLALDKFILARYPGSNSPASFQSNIHLVDPRNNINQKDSIYMNNVLHYQGYRFYQSSYDTDELGTYLSVNNDLPGTIVTYLGYILLALGMFLSLLNGKSRFRWLIRQTVSAKIILLAMVLFAGTNMPLFSSVKDSLVVDPATAKSFGSLLLQDRKGRVEPVSTLASEVVRKVTRTGNFMGLSPEQVFLGMNVYGEQWKNVPMIRISHPQLQDLFHTDQKLVSFYDCFTMEGKYRLAGVVDSAYHKKPASRNKFDTEVIRTDERVNICYMIYTWQFLNAFPKENDPNHTWFNPMEVSQKFSGMDSMFATNIFSMYFEAVAKNQPFQAESYLKAIKDYQYKYGKSIMPSIQKVKIETWYNHFDIFNRLMKYYGLLGAVLLLIQFISLFLKKYKVLLVTERILIGLIILSFLMHTSGLILRWYISGHAPWSNGFESLIYISWATMLAGIVFVRKSGIALSATALLSSVILSVAYLSWMDPEITNVVPVLNSYWLSIHVSVISSSYGFFALGALLGFLNLLFMFFRNEKNGERLSPHITQLTYVAETTLILGLYLVTIGTFLGGVWANESWGRYWGWDPKETWALATVLAYAFIAHMRFVPGLKGEFAFNFAALIGFSSVIMTYFGVNFYLSGLHSYSKGDPLPIPVWVYYSVFLILTVSLMAFLNNRRLMNKVKNESSK